MPAAFQFNAEDLRLAATPGLEVTAGALRVKAGQGIGLTNGGVEARTVANGGLMFDGSGNLDVKRKANGGIAVDANGLFLQVGQGLQVDGGGNLTQKLNGTSLLVDASGLALKLDGTAGGRLSVGANGTRVQAGGQGLPLSLAVQDIPANQFTYNGGSNTSTSNAALPKTPSAHANAADGFALLKGGIDNMRKVAGVPANAGEWRIDGANKIEVFGDITQSGDTYRVRYTSDV